MTETENTTKTKTFADTDEMCSFLYDNNYQVTGDLNGRGTIGNVIVKHHPELPRVGLWQRFKDGTCTIQLL